MLDSDDFDGELVNHTQAQKGSSTKAKRKVSSSIYSSMDISKLKLEKIGYQQTPVIKEEEEEDCKV